MTDAVERIDPRCDAGGHGYMLWMEYHDDGGYVRATDYDALAAKLAAAERRERQLLDTTATCRMLLRELNTAKAKLAEVEADVWEQRDLRNHQCKLKLEAMARADAAEAKLATCEKYRDAYAECDRIGTQAVRDLEAQLTEADAMIEAQQKDYASNNVRFAEAEHRAKVAEAALASMQSDALAFVLFLDENYRHSFGDIARKKIRAFYARIQTGEKE